VAAVAAGTLHSCALTSGGVVLCWGDNFYGQLGIGGAEQSLTPVEVFFTPINVTAISTGNQHTCVVTGGGAVKRWGENRSGQVGDGTTRDSIFPTDVVGLTSGITRIAAGGRHTCALTTGGGVKCWGANGAGQLGDGTTTQRLTPVDVIGITGATAIAVGVDHSCAILANGSARCWGYNIVGQDGDGTSGYVTIPAAARRVDPAFVFKAVSNSTSEPKEQVDR